MNINNQPLSQRIGYSFSRSSLFDQALTHRSFGKHNNERLEFLGDAILGAVISQILYQRFTNACEGELSQLRVSLVKGLTLAEVARELGVAEHLKLGSGEMKSGGARRDSILADAVEAIIGAIFLDAGIDVCKDRIEDWFSTRLDNLSLETLDKDAKTRLQEHLQGLGHELPIYQLIEATGDDHNQVFTVECLLPDIKQHSPGQGSSRKKAEQAAAENILQQMISAGQKIKGIQAISDPAYKNV